MHVPKLLNEELDQKWRTERQAERQQRPPELHYPTLSMSVAGARVNEWLEVEMLLIQQSSLPAQVQTARSNIAQTIRGKYRDVLTSSEEFIARKAAETAKEDRTR